MARRTSPSSLLILAVAVGLLTAWIQNRAPGSATSVESFRPVLPCPEARDDGCDVTAGATAVPEIVLSAESVCGDVGYLCVEVGKTGSHQVLRWPDGTNQLRIRVPLPPGVEPARARDLQSAAVRGIQYWQRRPLELVIDTRPRASEPADIEISWGGLSGSQLGLTRIGWTEGRDPTFEVESLALAIWSPESRNYPRTAEDVLLTAAHEMGHALGLPHSDSERDVMYATNTVRSLTPRDFRTLNTLYGLPFLATIKKHP